MNIVSDICVYDYLDYRTFLKDWYESAKRLTYGFSLRIFSQHAGFGSSNILKLVMDGDRNLTLKSLRKFIRGLRLEDDEAEYFRHLVFLNQAESPDEIKEHYLELMAIRNVHRLQTLSLDQGKRDLSEITFGIIRDNLPQLKKIIREFRSKLLNLVDDDVVPEEMMTMSIELIPVIPDEKKLTYKKLDRPV